MMRKLLKRFSAVLLAGCICLGIPGEVRAEKALLPELSGMIGMEGVSCYDCGSSTENGEIQVQSDSHSLKEGDTVEVQIFYDMDKDGFQTNLLGWEMNAYYDENVLEYVGMSVPDEHKIKYGVDDWSSLSNPGEFALREVALNVVYSSKTIQSAGLGESGRVAIVTYRVKKDVSSAQIYFLPLYLSSVSGEGHDYLADNSDEVDVLTLNLTDSPVTSSTLTLSTTPTQGSEEITVPINIEKNDGFNLLGLTLNFDDSLFTYDSLEIADSLKTKIGLESRYEVPDSGKVKASFIALEDITDVGNFLKLKLKVKDGVSAGTTSNVGVEITQVGNKAESSMSGTGTTCAVNITDTSGGEEQQPILGDVNADKKIDLVDAVYILQNYNEVREFTKAQETAADVTKDGTVNLKDALMIMKYFNEEITSF